jgi:hypothetical protein
VVTLDPAASTTFVVPGTGASIVYTEPTTDSHAVSVFATSDFPQYAQTQTLALAATAAPVISAVVESGFDALLVTYGEDVACPATGADGDFVYDSGYGAVGGTVTGCTAGAAGTHQLTLTGQFNAPGAASLIYTAPVVSTTANAVSAAGSTSIFAATQTFFPVKAV